MLLSTSISRWPRDYFFVSGLKSNSVSNSKTTGTPHRRSATSLHVHSKTKQAGAEHSAAASVSKSKKEKKIYLLTLPLRASINGTATHACVVRKFNLVQLSYTHT
jgi:predicted type IV restriction endonuclease